jgi:hypothetical protein
MNTITRNLKMNARGATLSVPVRVFWPVEDNGGLDCRHSVTSLGLAVSVVMQDDRQRRRAQAPLARRWQEGDLQSKRGKLKL